MTQTCPAEITLRVPGDRAYALVIRTMLGGVAILKDLDVDAMDDLRAAADEACDCLLNQGAPVQSLTLSVCDGGRELTVSLAAAFDPTAAASAAVDAAMTRAVLETLIPRVALDCADSGLIRRIDLTLPKAV
ncbi:MAG: hypothetical protein J1E43_08025 [Christensenellaceae bacterium]|nr:hypothetical protein [Christensenellaceae bacterium]